MKICVVDDEKEVRESIIHKLKALVPAADLYDVEFGRKALESIRLVRPDLLFTDIRMPEMDGLEILNAVKREDPRIQVVILSGFDDFEYARKALQYGAVDYILKPADREQLRENVEKARQRIESAFLQALEPSLVKLSDEYVFVHEIRCFNTSLWFDERQRKEIRFGVQEELVRQWGNAVLMTFSVNSDYGGVVAAAEPGGNEPGFEAKIGFLPAMRESIRKWESWRFFGGDRTAAQDARGRFPESAKKIGQLRHQILNCAKTGDDRRLASSLQEWLEALGELDFQRLRKECVSLMALLDEGLVVNNDVIVLEEEKMHYWTQWASKHKTWEELRRSIHNFVVEGCRALHKMSHSTGNGWFELAVQLVNRSRDPNLSLESVADEVGVHSVTLSRIFKQRTGMNFVKYLVKIRLNHAKTLLLETDKNINDIAEEVGYADYRYFRTLFKKEFGLTPSEYRRSHGIASSGDETDLEARG